MFTSKNFKEALEIMEFKTEDGIEYEKEFSDFEIALKANLDTQKLYYPESIKGRERNDYYDDSHKENLVVFECVNRLLEKGYRPNIEIHKMMVDSCFLTGSRNEAVNGCFFTLQE